MKARRGFVAKLMASDDRSVDSIIVGGMAALFALILFGGYVIFKDPSTSMPFAFPFGGAAGALLAAIGGGRRLRDWNAPAEPAAPPKA